MTGEEPPNDKAEELSLEPNFIEDVEQYLATNKIDNVDVLIANLQQKLQMYTMGENRALTRRQKQMERQAHLNKSIACVKMLLDKSKSEEDAIVDYPLGGTSNTCSSAEESLCSPRLVSPVNQPPERCSQCFRSSSYSCCQERLPLAGSRCDGGVPAEGR